jgi:hypothetical protein
MVKRMGRELPYFYLTKKRPGAVSAQAIELSINQNEDIYSVSN